MSSEATIRNVHAALSVETLEALSNKGLLRRAQKDLERGEVTAAECAGDTLVVTVGGQRVSLVEAGPAKATCTCPAAGVCQHILAACLHLMQEMPGTADEGGTPQSPGGERVLDEWKALRDEDVIATYGLPDLRIAHELALTHQVTITIQDALVVGFPALNAEVRGVPSAGLAGIIVRGPAEKRHRHFAAAAVLAVRERAGLSWEPPSTKSESAASAPLHRDSLLRTVASTLEEILGAGLARLPPAMVERLDALSVSAQTAELHRLNLLLQRLASQARDWHLRRPHADLGEIFENMATAYALVHGLMTKPQSHLTGVAREAYMEVGALNLAGVAAWPWRTQSGYEGLTLLLWDQGSSSWATWSEARPRVFQGNSGFDAVSRYTQAGPWEGAESPAQIAHSRFRLTKARKNRWNRLSSSTQTRALVTGMTTPTDVGAPVIEDWAALDDLLDKATPPGLRERDPRVAFQMVKPDQWLRQPFDPIAQCLSWLLRDPSGRLLELHLPYDELNRPAIECLEKFSNHELEDCKLVGRCQRINNMLRIFPLAILTPTKAVEVFFATQVKGNQSSAVYAANLPPPGTDEVDEQYQEQEVAPDPIPGNALGQLLLSATSSLEWIAETGIQNRNADARSRLKEAGASLEQLGARHLANLVELAASSQEPPALMKLRWVLLLAHRSMAR